MPGRRVSVWECFCRIVGLEGEMSFKVGGKPPHTPLFSFLFQEEFIFKELVRIEG